MQILVIFPICFTSCAFFCTSNCRNDNCTFSADTFSKTHNLPVFICTKSTKDPIRLWIGLPRCRWGDTIYLIQNRRFPPWTSKIEIAALGTITEAQKLTSIEGILATVQPWQTRGLFLSFTVLPFVLMFVSYLIYRRHYTLDENRYDKICRELARRKGQIL